MSFHYTIAFDLRFSNDIGPYDVRTIEYLLGLSDQPPQVFPTHSCYGMTFSMENRGTHPAGLLDRSNFPTRQVPGSQLHLRMQGRKLEAVYEDELPFLCWLATFSDLQGFAGHVRGDETADLLMLFYIFDRQLHLVDDVTEPAVSLITQQKRDVSRRGKA